jgi:hypothetical protein
LSISRERDGRHHAVAATRLPTTSKPKAAAVADLAAERRWRLVRDLNLAPTVPVPCTGCCRCYGVPMGSGCGS